MDKEDGNWNAVWESKTRIVENGWIVEMRIPYSALRFPEKSNAPLVIKYVQEYPPIQLE
ncbi:MAG: hypothetical protein Q7U47_09760 [Paludibacter sp.]|nr:hypothetical protein [Paludibacter sp.]